MRSKRLTIASSRSIIIGLQAGKVLDPHLNIILFHVNQVDTQAIPDIM